MKTLDDLDGTRWSGTSELWLDPLGDVVQQADCTIAIDDGTIRYTWSYEGKAQEGSIERRAGGARFRDTWHQTDPVEGDDVPGSRGLLHVAYTYMVEWGWRINLCLREPTDELVLQMTNVAPWGEEVRAVRMVCVRDPS